MTVGGIVSVTVGGVSFMVQSDGFIPGTQVVVIGGMFLNVGNGMKGVLLNGAVCVIL